MYPAGSSPGWSVFFPSDSDLSLLQAAQLVSVSSRQLVWSQSLLCSWACLRVILSHLVEGRIQSVSSISDTCKHSYKQAKPKLRIPHFLGAPYTNPHITQGHCYIFNNQDSVASTAPWDSMEVFSSSCLSTSQETWIEKRKKGNHTPYLGQKKDTQTLRSSGDHLLWAEVP